MKKISAFLILVFIASGVFPDWQDFPVKSGESVWASSSLTETIRGRTVTYGPEALFDNDINTPWVEGSRGNGAGESVTVMTQMPVQSFSIANGFARSPSLFEKNNRAKKISISFVAGFTGPGMVTELDYYLYLLKDFPSDTVIEIKDTADIQSFDFPFTTEEQQEIILSVLKDFAEENPSMFSFLLDDLGINEEDYTSYMNMRLITEIYGFIGFRITIDEVYKGSAYDDTCISEIKVELEDF